MSKPCNWCTRDTQDTCPECKGTGVVGDLPDTSASANASPVVNKHEHPPTPTIEELLDFIENYGASGVTNEYTDYETSRAQAKAALTLLITKARIDELDKLRHTSYENTWLDHDDYAKGIYKRITELKATTQEPDHED